MMMATVLFFGMFQTSPLFLKSSKHSALLPLLLPLPGSSNKTWVVPAYQLLFLISSFLHFLYYSCALFFSFLEIQKDLMLE